MNIKGKIVTLRAIEENDLEFLRGIINDPEIERMVAGYSFPVSSIAQKKWFETISNDKNNLRLIVEIEEEGVVGFANLVDFDWKNRSAFHGIKLGRRTTTRRGVGTDVVMAIMRYAFEELQLNRLDGSIIEYNMASQKLYCSRCGWKIEGTRREAIFRENRFHDQLIVGILRSDYFKLIEQNNYWNT